jgi:sugar/nucleoside kinase (ribokinase family)
VDLGVAEDIEIDDWALLESADLVYVSYAPQLVEALISRGVGPRLIVGLEQWMASPAVLKACESCLLVVTNEAGANAFNISELPAVVVTRGAAGVELRNRGVMVDFIPATSVNTLDSTGAGDSFAGALCYSLAIGSNLAISLRFATTTAALSTLSRGAQAALPSLEQVTAKMAENGANEVAANLV